LGAWYRTQYATLLKEDKATFGDLFGHLGEGLKPPRRPQLLHFYSSRRYEGHIKVRVEERMATLRKRAERTGGPPPVAITVQNKVTQECWDDESDMFRQEMQREHQVLVKAWKDSHADGPTRTAEELNA
jgi:hypothetical protein